MDVELLRWPEDEERRRELGLRGRPRLLLVSPDAVPPLIVDQTEDWVRLPAPPADVAARVRALSERALVRDDDRPVLNDRLLRRGGAWVALPPTEALVVGVLLDRYETVVPRAELIAAGWPGESPARNVFDVTLVRLRRRLGGVGLSITTVRQRGYLLGAVSPR